MHIFRRYDAYSIEYTQRLCHKFEDLTGKTNYFLLKLLSGLFAAFVLFFVSLDEIHRISSDTWRNVFLFGLFCFFFYISFFYCDDAEDDAQQRVFENLSNGNEVINPARANEIWIRLRLSMAASIILLCVFLAICAIAYSERMGDPVVLVYMATSLVTPVLIWLCLLLDACDPLPESGGPA